jgi:hypothetical protein
MEKPNKKLNLQKQNNKNYIERILELDLFELRTFPT